jgi:CDGSH-type Zn-finger protein
MSADDVEIVPYQDGPYLVRGPVALRDQDGRWIATGRRTIALCRCGKSRMRPFCDGTHQLVRFKAPSGPEQKRRLGTDPGAVLADVEGGRPARRWNGTFHKQFDDGAADASGLAGPDDAIARGVSLLSAARLLLAMSATSPANSEELDWETPCICLIRGTIEELVKAPGATDRDVSKVIEQLSVMVAQLEAQGGRA